MPSVLRNLKQELDSYDHPVLPSPVGDAKKAVEKAKKELKSAEKTLEERLKKKESMIRAINILEEANESQDKEDT